MNPSDPEYQHLKSKAEEFYTEYGRLKDILRQDRSNQEIGSRLNQIRTEYERINSLLSQVDTNQKTQQPTFDVSRLEPAPFKTTPPVVMPKTTSGDSRILSILGYFQPRTVAAFLILLFLLSVIFLISSDRLGFYSVPTSSMEPTLIPGDRLIAFSQETYPRGTVVVIYDTKNPGDFLVKRIVALGGDSVTIDRGSLFINGKAIDEPYINESIRYRFGPLIIPEGQVFLLGDNRNASEDGHIWKQGTPMDLIVGAVHYIYSPGNRRAALEDFTDTFRNSK